MAKFSIQEFEKLPLMGILRGVEPSKVAPLLEAVISAGLKTIEITMNTKGAAEIIRKASKIVSGRMSVGAGTVLSMDDLEAALCAGSEFIVMPIFDSKIVSACNERGIPVFPGGFTPQEVFNAWRGGADMVKVFPSSALGAKYIKDLKGPFDKIKLMAVGGVRLENINEFFSSGASGVAFGGSVFKKEWMDGNNFDRIGEVVRSYVGEVSKAIE